MKGEDKVRINNSSITNKRLTKVRENETELHSVKYIEDKVYHRFITEINGPMNTGYLNRSKRIGTVLTLWQ